MAIYKHNPINWFEIPVIDLQRAKSFYEYIFNIELTLNEMGQLKMAWFPMHENAPGATGTLIKAKSYVPSQSGTLVYFSVNDIEGTLQKIEQKEGTIINPKSSIGQHGFVAHFTDCEGNRVALHSKN
ncbi:MAG: VOC family protein [Caldithrix sp.]|nr:VOC family protein [Caldithrix sp.]